MCARVSSTLASSSKDHLEYCIPCCTRIFIPNVALVCLKMVLEGNYYLTAPTPVPYCDNLHTTVLPYILWQTLMRSLEIVDDHMLVPCTNEVCAPVTVKASQHHYSAAS